MIKNILSKYLKINILIIIALSIVIIGIPGVKSNAASSNTTLPTTPVITAPLDNSSTQSLRPIISGTGDSNSTIMISVDGTADVNLINATSSGDWSYLPSTNLNEGKHTIIAQTKNTTTGELSAASNKITINIDKTAPVKPVIDAKLNNITTNNIMLQITGTAETNSVVTVNIDGINYNGAINTGGKWTYTPQTNFVYGKHTVVAYAVDAAGNTSSMSTAINFNIDNIPPTAPFIDPSIYNSLLNTQKPVITGSAEIGAKIVVTVDGVDAKASTATDSKGAWKYTQAAALDDGTHFISAKAIDAAGNVGPNCQIVTITIDSTAPGTPVIIVPTDNYVTNNPRFMIMGTAAVYSRVVINIDGKDSSLIPTDALGNWNYIAVSNLTDGIHKINVKAYDNSNNVSAASNTISITIKTAPPKKPVISSAINNSITNNIHPLISGTADANTYITVNIDGVDYTNVTMADSSGNWSYIPAATLAPGKHFITAKATDIFQNSGIASPYTTIYIDTQAPAAPVIDQSFNNTFVNNIKPVIMGTSEAGASVIVTIDGIDGKTSAIADDSGKWTYTPAISLYEGRHTVTAMARDVAGNLSLSSVLFSFTVNVTAPNTPEIVLPLGNTITNNPKPMISGTADPNSQIVVIIDGAEAKTFATASSNGNWSFTPVDNIKDGKHNITVKAKNIANNVSPASNATILTIDTTPPSKPLITAPANNTRTNNQKLTISGTAEKGSKITVNIDEKDFVDCTVADSSGKWSYVYAGVLSSGNHSIKVMSKDDMNNVGIYSEPTVVVIDFSPPVVTINSPEEGGAVNNQNPSVTGSVKPNSKVYITVDGKEIAAPINADNDGNWKYKIATKLAEGSHELSTRAVDPANNASTVTTKSKFTVDITLPSTPTIMIPINNAEINTKAIEINGTSEPDVNVIVYINGAEQAEPPTSDENGKWTFTSKELEEGKYTIAVKARDLAGNTSSPSSAVNITVDITPPKTPTITSLKNGAILKDYKPAIIGSGDKNSVIIINIDGVDIIDKTIVDAKGNYSYKPSKNLKDGEHKLIVSAKDSAGNISSLSSPIKIIIGKAPSKPPIVNLPTKASPDKTPIKTVKLPQKPIVKTPQNKANTKNRKPSINGTSDPKARLIITLKLGKTQIVFNTVANIKGIWSVIPTKNLKPGSYTILAKVNGTTTKLSPVSNAITLKIIK